MHRHVRLSRNAASTDCCPFRSLGIVTSFPSHAIPHHSGRAVSHAPPVLQTYECQEDESKSRSLITTMNVVAQAFQPASRTQAGKPALPISALRCDRPAF